MVVSCHAGKLDWSSSRSYSVLPDHPLECGDDASLPVSIASETHRRDAEGL